MLTWLKNLFSSFDRQTVAAERAAKAMEDIAGDLESVRDQFRARLGIAPAEAKALPAPEPDAEPTETPKAAKGRAR